MKYFRVAYDEHVYSTGGYDPDDEWTRDSTETNITVNGVVEVNDKVYSDLYLEDGPVDRLYMVWCRYETGDSFGRDTGKAEWVSLHRDLEVAEKNAMRIREHDRRNGTGSRSSSTVKLLTDEGKEYDCYTPWVGFFERLEDIIVQSVDVLEEKLVKRY